MKTNLLVLIALIVLSINLETLWADPIVTHRQGSNGRAEYVHAVIHNKDLDTGEPTSKNQKMAAQVRAMGKAKDDCGHIVANILGGPMKLYNLFPQNLNKNRGEFKNTVETHVKDFLKLYKNVNDYVDYEITLVYAKSTDTRPTMLKFTAKFYINNKLAKFTDIPVNGKHHVPANPYVGAIQNP